MKTSELWMTWITPSLQLWALVLWTTGVEDDIKNSGSWAQDSRCYKLLKAMHGSHEIMTLEPMNSLGLWMIWTILHCDIKPLDAMNSIGLWMTWTTMGRELRAIDVMNNLVSWLIRMTIGCEPSALDAMNNSGLWITWMTPSCELKA